MRKFTFVLAWLVLAIPCSAKIIYVDADAAGANDGSSWTNAYNYLQDALMMASAGDEIRVAQGTYKPDQFVLSARPNLGRMETFHLKNGVAIKGGYAGFGEPDPDARDIDSYVSVLSGDIAGNDIAVGSPEELLTEPTRAENSYHVVTAIGVNASAVLDGFSITGGQANGGTYEEKYGGGMYNYDASPTVTDCKFGANSAADRGGGMYIGHGSGEPTLSHCTFTFNQAVMGGGIMSYGAPLLTRCTFVVNVAGLGGGMWSSGGELSRCVFGGNRSDYKGGGIFMSHDTSLTSCMLSGNSAVSGGAVFAEDCDITVTGCTITGNRASYVGGVHSDEGSTFVSNCILWSNMDADGEDETAQIETVELLTVDYCCIQGWTGALGGTGNIGANPAFVEPGHWDTTGAWVDGDYHLVSSSPCINTGDPDYAAGPDETDLDSNPRVIGSQIDMGAYEFQGPSTWYIDGANGDDNNEGLTPETAFATIQKGIDMARNGDTVIVLSGTYSGDGNRDLDFCGKAIMVRSKNGPGNCIIDCNGTEADFHRGFYFHNEEDENSIIDGFTITNGVHTTGGGILCTLEASPTIRNNVIKANRVPYDWDGGGGIACRRGASPLIIYNIIQDNHCEPGSGGGGIHCYEAGSPRIINNIITGNSSSYGGGIEIAIFTDTAVIENNVIVGNTASWAAGIICWGTDHEVTIQNNTITGNTAIDVVGGIQIENGIITNCIIWDNRDSDGMDESAQIAGSSLAVNYCCIRGWAGSLGGTGNVDVDPCFVEPGYWDADGAWVEGDYHLLMDSVCINAGDPNYVSGPNETDLDGRERVICGRIDMGAYEFHCPQVLYVDADATGNNDGSSWTDAYNRLQDVLAVACESDEIRVAQGIYKPDQGGGNMAGDRMTTFQLKNGVVVKGGYAGYGEADPDAWDVDLYETVLSGDLAGDDVGDLHDASRAENSYHVVTGSGTDASAVLDGFIITAGNAFNTKCSSYDNGGGMYNNNGSPTVANCTFTRNTASDQCGGGGAGMYNKYSSPTVISCEFVGNEYIIADDDGGGGMNNYRSNPTLIDCSFRDNKSNGDGGGMLNINSNPTLRRCIFINNSSTGEGGGMQNEFSNSVLTNCMFINNSSFHEGGGMYGYYGTATLVNCTFSDNYADTGGAMYYRNDSFTLTNCILWDNEPDEIRVFGGTPVVTYCDVKGGWDGEGNIDAEPLFADSDNGDYRLSAGSPCVDAGDNDSVPPDVCDIDGNARIYDGDGDGEAVVDMGAYELSMLPLEVPMKLVPQALNPGSHGKWIKAHFVLPEGYTIEDVDTSRPAEFEQFPLTSESMEVFVNKEDLVEVIAAFDRSVFCGIGPFEGDVTVVGYLTSGRRFRGTDTIKIVNNKLKYLDVLASHWLSVCSAPDWCSGADLDQDSEVNFVDFALLDGCCFEVIKD